MHELGLVYQVVRTIDSVVTEQGLSEVDEIVLDVGEMTDVVPKFIEEAWQAAKHSTSYPNAKMTVNVIRGRAKCNTCQHEDYVKNMGFECPQCNGTNFTITSGREFEINHIVAK